MKLYNLNKIVGEDGIEIAKEKIILKNEEELVFKVRVRIVNDELEWYKYYNKTEDGWISEVIRGYSYKQANEKIKKGDLKCFALITEVVQENDEKMRSSAMIEGLLQEKEETVQELEDKYYLTLEAEECLWCLKNYINDKLKI